MFRFLYDFLINKPAHRHPSHSRLYSANRPADAPLLLAQYKNPLGPSIKQPQAQVGVPQANVRQLRVAGRLENSKWAAPNPL